MKASVLVSPGTNEIVDVAVPQIGKDEVLIRVKVCGVCASELYPWENGIKGVRPILGHEGVGIIEQVGEDVPGFQIGDRVTGLFHQSFAEYTKSKYINLVKVPEQLNDFEAMGEPLSCLVSGANRTPVSLGDEVAIVGAGFMGLGFMKLMKLKGAGKIVVVDKRKEALDHAKRLGADEVCFPGEVDPKYKVVDWGQIGQGIKVSVEASGSQDGLELAGEMTAVHGVLSVVGFHQSNNGFRNVNMSLWNWKAITVVNAHERRTDVHLEAMKSIFELIQKGQFPIRDLITNVYSLDEVDAAFHDLKNKPQGFIKAAIRISS